jgi:hypothetical protein
MVWLYHVYLTIYLLDDFCMVSMWGDTKNHAAMNISEQEFG